MMGLRSQPYRPWKDHLQYPTVVAQTAKGRCRLIIFYYESAVIDPQNMRTYLQVEELQYNHMNEPAWIQAGPLLEHQCLTDVILMSMDLRPQDDKEWVDPTKWKNKIKPIMALRTHRRILLEGEVLEPRDLFWNPRTELWESCNIPGITLNPGGAKALWFRPPLICPAPKQ